ncbi:MAG: hypothetical protein LUF35_02770 [Lachnospiraceae bacterium]|nr:hypothetical protein [Lachnospiraceae bacterium]
MISRVNAIFNSLSSAFLDMMEFQSNHYLKFKKESASLLLLIFVVVVKLIVGVGTNKDKLLKTVISFPSELTYIILAYLASMLLENAGELNSDNWEARFFICILFLIFQYALEASLYRSLENAKARPPAVAKICAFIGILSIGFLLYSLTFVIYLMVMYQGWVI